MPKYANSFIRAALEELQMEAAAQATPPVSVMENGSAVTEVNIDTSKDAVAELMERNATLESSTAILEQETFDNDVDAVSTVSDSISKDLDEVVAAGAALEELAVMCHYSVKIGEANKASVAGMSFALKQITDRFDMPNVMAALEDAGAAETTEAGKLSLVGEKAADTSKTLGKRLIDGIKRIVGWIISVIRTALARSTRVAAKAGELESQIGGIDESKTIDAKPFIHSLNLVEGGGDVKKQYLDYFTIASKTLYGFFSESFKNDMTQAAAATGTPEEVKAKLNAVVKAALSVIYTESGTGGDVSVEIPKDIAEKDLVVGLTKPCIGGLQLYLASAMEDPKVFFVRAGVSKKELKFDAPETIPVVDKYLAKNGLATVKKWMADQKDLEKSMNALMAIPVPDGADMGPVGYYLQTLSAMVTGAAPHLLRLNMKNSASFVSYVEKSISASKATEPAKAE